VGVRRAPVSAADPVEGLPSTSGTSGAPGTPLSERCVPFGVGGALLSVPGLTVRSGRRAALAVHGRPGWC
jgi:hypothetical protein